MGCGGSTGRIYAANNAIEMGDTSPEAQELILSVDYTAAAKDGRIPFVTACKHGRLGMVKSMVADRAAKQRLTHSVVDRGLLAACEFETSVPLVHFLVETLHVDINCHSEEGNTALVLLAALTPQMPADQVRAKLEAAHFLLGQGAETGLRNQQGMTAMTTACRDDNFPFAVLVADWGGNIMEIKRWMDDPANQKNWVAGCILARFAFKHQKFVAGLRKQFMEMFDRDGNGELDRRELTTFIAAHVKMAFKAGLMPTAEFFDDGTLEITHIEQLLETRCRDMLRGYFSMDKDHDGTYSFDELLPIVQDFYTNLWTQNKPKNIDINLDVKAMLTKKGERGDEPVVATRGGGGGAAAAATTVDYGAGTVNYGAGTVNYGAGTVAPGAVDYGAGTLGGGGEAPLPPNWMAIVDPSSGATYYAHKITRETTWERPVA